MLPRSNVPETDKSRHNLNSIQSPGCRIIKRTILSSYFILFQIIVVGIIMISRTGTIPHLTLVCLPSPLQNRLIVVSMFQPRFVDICFSLFLITFFDLFQVIPIFASV